MNSYQRAKQRALKFQPKDNQELLKGQDIDNYVDKVMEELTNSFFYQLKRIGGESCGCCYRMDDSDLEKLKKEFEDER